MSEFEQLYREVILDHYRSPRNHGLLEPRDAYAEGQNPRAGRVRYPQAIARTPGVLSF